jgi:uncharacterized phiE125 gp8 family phage protein
MGLALVTGPTQAAMSLGEAKDHLRETNSDQDGLIVAFIQSAQEFIENATRRKLITQTLDYTIDYEWPCLPLGSYVRHRIELPLMQIASVTSVTYLDSTGATQTLASNQYVVVANAPIPFIEPAYGVTWPDVYCQPSTITVRFVAGTSLSDVPHSLMQAMRMLLGHWYNIREAVNIGNVTSEIPLGVEALLSPYRYSRAA